VRLSSSRCCLLCFDSFILSVVRVSVLPSVIASSLETPPLLLLFISQLIASQFWPLFLALSSLFLFATTLFASQSYPLLLTCRDPNSSSLLRSSLLLIFQLFASVLPSVSCFDSPLPPPLFFFLCLSQAVTSQPWPRLFASSLDTPARDSSSSSLAGALEICKHKHCTVRA
jgi:hypothetical protein